MGHCLWYFNIANAFVCTVLYIFVNVYHLGLEGSMKDDAFDNVPFICIPRF